MTKVMVAFALIVLVWLFGCESQIDQESRDILLEEYRGITQEAMGWD